MPIGDHVYKRKRSEMTEHRLASPTNTPAIIQEQEPFPSAHTIKLSPKEMSQGRSVCQSRGARQEHIGIGRAQLTNKTIGRPLFICISWPSYPSFLSPKLQLRVAKPKISGEISSERPSLAPDRNCEVGLWTSNAKTNTK